MHDLDLTVNMLGLCDPSNLLFEYSFYPPRSDALFSNYFEDLLPMRDAMCVRLSDGVRPSHAGIVSERLIVGSRKQRHTIANGL